jgi:hypothetical protein
LLLACESEKSHTDLPFSDEVIDSLSPEALIAMARSKRTLAAAAKRDEMHAGGPDYADGSTLYPTCVE